MAVLTSMQVSMQKPGTVGSLLKHEVADSQKYGFQAQGSLWNEVENPVRRCWYGTFDQPARQVAWENPRMIRKAACSLRDGADGE